MNINEIKLNPDNPRLIKDNKFKKLVASIKDFPKMMSLRPIIVDDTMTILGGNMRYSALREAGYTDLPDEWVKQAKDLTEEEKKQFVIKDNLPFGEWDWDILANNFEIKDLLEWGFDEKELKIEQEVEEDEAPEVSDEPAISKLGEVYQLGRHRLMCGSAKNLDDVQKLTDGVLTDLVLSSPPYNTGMHKKADATRLHHMFKDNLTPVEWQELIQDSLTNMFAVTKGSAVFYICIDWRNVGEVKDLVEELIPVHNVIVWDKMVHGLGSDYKFTYEMIIVGKKGEPKIENRIGTDYQDVWHVQRKVGFNEDHATAKPIELLKKPILHASKQDDIVLDLFGDSGSTLIACEQTNRICYMMELDPKYVDVIRKRYAKFVGKETEWQTTPIVKQ